LSDHRNRSARCRVYPYVMWIAAGIMWFIVLLLAGVAIARR